MACNGSHPRLRFDRAKTQELRERLSAGAGFDDVLEEAFAVVREAAWRVLELRHYDVQVIYTRTFVFSACFYPCDTRMYGFVVIDTFIFGGWFSLEKTAFSLEENAAAVANINHSGR